MYDFDSFYDFHYILFFELFQQRGILCSLFYISMIINYFGEIDINLKKNVTFNAIKFDDVLQNANSGIIFLFPFIRRSEGVCKSQRLM